MIAWRAGVVLESVARWDGACESTVALDGEDRTVRALSYPHLVGEIVPGAHVLLNATALLRGLGTGGYALVVARTDTLVPDPLPGPGHLVKARYTPLQAMVLGVDDQESPHHHVLRDADDLAGLPVVVADLHSALPAVIAGARLAADRLGRAAPRVAYVMTDGGALPAWFSRAVDGLRSAGWIDACVTTGQAFGGDHEAVTVHTGLLSARHVVGADLVVVAQGPGNLGTGTRWGFSGVAAGEALNAAGVLGGRPIASLRVSGADPRERHLGVSHHSSTAYGRVALSPADVVLPVFSPDLPGTPQDLTADPDPAAWTALADRVGAQAAALTMPQGRHTAVPEVAGTDLLDALRTCPVRLSTMGRGLDADPAAFLAAAVAGVHAVAGA